MTATQSFLVFLVGVLGAVVGGLLGYAKSDQPFRWKSVIVTAVTGALGGLLQLGLVNWANIEFGIPALVQAALIGLGVDFTAKKTFLTKLV